MLVHNDEKRFSIYSQALYIFVFSVRENGTVIDSNKYTLIILFPMYANVIHYKLNCLFFKAALKP